MLNSYVVASSGLSIQPEDYKFVYTVCQSKYLNANEKSFAIRVLKLEEEKKQQKFRHRNK